MMFCVLSYTYMYFLSTNSIILLSSFIVSFPSLSLSLSPSYLSHNISMVDRLLEMTHHHKVSGLVPAVVKSMVVDMAQNCSSANP